MTRATAAALQGLAEALPAGAAVSIPREWLLELLAGQLPSVTTTAAGAAAADFTVRDLAGRYGRRPSTCRAWVEAGRFPGSYRMHGTREWRIPAAALMAFEEAERDRAGSREPAPRRSAKAVDLGAWKSAS